MCRIHTSRRGERWPFLLALLVAGLAVCAAAQDCRIITVSGDGWDHITYPCKELSRREVRRWVRLSPYGSGSNVMQVPEKLENWDRGDKDYIQNPGPAINLHNARVNLARIRARIRELDPARWPPGLKPVVLYLRKIQRFGLWMEQNRFDFWRTGDASVFDRKFDSFRSRSICETSLARISTASRPVAAEVAQHDLNNCLWRAAPGIVGTYPRPAWEKFLAAHHIHEEDFQEQF